MPKLQQRPFSITIFVPDGDPDSLRLVEKSNWTGIGVVFNRTNYKQVVIQEEFNKTGVYVLVGSSEGSGLPTIYIGEGDPVKDRLNQHYSKKDFWDWAVFFVTKDNSLNKAHVQRLESRLLELAHAAKQCKIDNTQKPLAPTLSKSQTADVESFLLDVLSIFPLLGLGVFEKTETTSKPGELLFIEAKGIKATGYEDPKGFVVIKGSQLVKDEVPSIHAYMTTLRKDMLEQGVISANGNANVFNQDYVFNSSSTAAGVIQGRTANGRKDWKNKEGKTLREIQEAAANDEVE
ncbi:MAG: GIY-YIG nuclease family protein [Pirellula sp.]